MLRNLLLIPFLLTALALKAQTPWNVDPQQPKREVRAVWLTTLSGLDWPHTPATSERTRERQKQELRDIMDRLQAVGINTVLLQTRVRGSVIYPSDLEPWDAALTGHAGQNPGYDPLDFAIGEAHRRGMELHAWVVTIPVANKKYMDPGEPTTRERITAVCREITERYDVDGIHLDYIRYPENGIPFNDAKTYNKYGKGQNKAQWRRDNVTAIVRSVHRAVKALKPWVKVSSSPVGKFRDTGRASSKGWNCYDAVYQDAQGWLREGIQDMLFPMMYFTGNHFYPFVIDWAEGAYGRHIVPGLGIYFLSPREKNWPLNTVLSELAYLRRHGMAGQAYFRSRFLTDDVKGIYTHLQQTFYPYPALTPACPWIDDEAPTAPTDPQLTPTDGGMARLTWAPSSDNMAEGGVRYCVYASRHWPVDTGRAENLVATGLTECAWTLNGKAAPYLAVTAVDRAGNESEPLQCSASPRHTTDEGNLPPGVLMIRNLRK